MFLQFMTVRYSNIFKKGESKTKLDLQFSNFLFCANPNHLVKQIFVKASKLSNPQ